MCVDEKDVKMLNHKIDALAKSMGQRLANLKKDTAEIKSHLVKFNGRVGEVEQKTRDQEEINRRKELDCPYRDTIAKMAENAMTREALKRYIEERDKKQAYRMKAIGAVLAAVFALVSGLINYVL